MSVILLHFDVVLGFRVIVELQDVVLGATEVELLQLVQLLGVVFGTIEVELLQLVRLLDVVFGTS